MYAINNSNLNLSWIGMFIFMPEVHSTCSICSQNFKREDHLKYHEVICITEIEVSTMVDKLIKSDKSVPEGESVADETPSENNDPNKINDVVDINSTAAFSHDAYPRYCCS